jgi:hypothetical protein
MRQRLNDRAREGGSVPDLGDIQDLGDMQGMAA